MCIIIAFNELGHKNYLHVFTDEYVVIELAMQMSLKYQKMQ